MKTNEPIHDYDQRLIRARHSLKLLPNGEVAIRFLDHLGALSLSSKLTLSYQINEENRKHTTLFRIEILSFKKDISSGTEHTL